MWALLGLLGRETFLCDGHLPRYYVVKMRNAIWERRLFLNINPMRYQPPKATVYLQFGIALII